MYAYDKGIKSKNSKHKESPYRKMKSRCRILYVKNHDLTTQAHVFLMKISSLGCLEVFWINRNSSSNLLDVQGFCRILQGPSWPSPIQQANVALPQGATSFQEQLQGSESGPCIRVLAGPKSRLRVPRSLLGQRPFLPSRVCSACAENPFGTDSASLHQASGSKPCLRALGAEQRARLPSSVRPLPASFFPSSKCRPAWLRPKQEITSTLLAPSVGRNNSHGSRMILVPEHREPYDKVLPVAGGLPSTCSPRRRRCSSYYRDRGRPGARRRRACNRLGDGRTTGIDAATDRHLPGPPGPTCRAAGPGSLRSAGALGRIVSPAITRTSCPSRVDSGAAR
ncbi:hypothetical protein Taro_025363 [Colocasia esculenta]|uniref:Uncharacterized protein n=1 Tax=Colocasia esculenta TaxID=4460 RepID=A0A843V331_COLES|nr:hypothetical protein [Colocasia esculenta]